MRCLFPKDVVVTSSEGHKQTWKVPCGKCINCRINKQSEWAFRIEEEYRYTRFRLKGSAYFFTFTYRDENLWYGSTEDPILCYDDIRTFVRSLDQRIRRKFAAKQRYFLCGEYGDTFQRPHFHAVIFFSVPISVEYLKSCVPQLWGKGFVTISSFTMNRAKYVAKYVCKSDSRRYEVLPRSFKSQSLGLNKDSSILYLNKRYRKDVETTLRASKGIVLDMEGKPRMIPRCYNRLIYSDAEKREHNLEPDLNLEKKIIELRERGFKNPLDHIYETAVEQNRLGELKAMQRKYFKSRKKYARI